MSVLLNLEQDVVMTNKIKTNSYLQKSCMIADRFLNKSLVMY